MFNSRIRDLSPEERALIAGGAQMTTNDLDTVQVRPGDDWGGVQASLPDDVWPDLNPPDWGDSYDQGPDYNGSDGGGGSGVNESSSTINISTSASVDNEGVAKAVQTWELPDRDLTFSLTEKLDLTTGTWNLAGSGSFRDGSQNYTLGFTTDQFSISGYRASLTHDFGDGISFTVGLTFNPDSKTFNSDLGVTVKGF